MPSNLLTACASIIGLLLITAGRADAQIISITATNYAAGPPQSAQPKGQYSVPVAEATASWRILIDYGTIANGEFTPWQAGANITINPAGGGYSIGSKSRHQRSWQIHQTTCLLGLDCKST